MLQTHTYVGLRPAVCVALHFGICCPHKPSVTPSDQVTVSQVAVIRIAFEEIIPQRCLNGNNTVGYPELPPSHRGYVVCGSLFGTVGLAVELLFDLCCDGYIVRCRGNVVGTMPSSNCCYGGCNYLVFLTVK